MPGTGILSEIAGFNSYDLVFLIEFVQNRPKTEYSTQIAVAQITRLSAVEAMTSDCVATSPPAISLAFASKR